jgi:hypothetical protein
MKKSKIPEKISFVMGSLPVIYSEDRIMYWNFYEAIVDTLRPDDVHEFMLVETIANCDWEIRGRDDHNITRQGCSAACSRLVS